MNEFAYKEGDVDLFVSNFAHSLPNEDTLISTEVNIDSKMEELTKEVSKKIFKGLASKNKGPVKEEEIDSDDMNEPSGEEEKWEDEEDGQDYYYVKSQTAITFCGVGTRRNIQVINCGDRTPEDALMDFDIDCVTFAYDGKQVYALPRGRRAINTLCNFMDPFVLRFKRSRNRVAKYHSRGFHHLLFECCIHTPRCDIVLDPNVHAIWGRTKGLFGFFQSPILPFLLPFPFPPFLSPFPPFLSSFPFPFPTGPAPASSPLPSSLPFPFGSPLICSFYHARLPLRSSLSFLHPSLFPFPSPIFYFFLFLSPFPFPFPSSFPFPLLHHLPFLSLLPSLCSKHPFQSSPTIEFSSFSYVLTISRFLAFRLSLPSSLLLPSFLPSKCKAKGNILKRGLFYLFICILKWN